MENISKVNTTYRVLPFENDALKTHFRKLTEMVKSKEGLFSTVSLTVNDLEARLSRMINKA